MAAIVRLKRRRQDDPAESLLVSCKRSKSDADSEDVTKKVFKFAGTFNTESCTVTHAVREAIRKEKLQNSYKHHQYESSHLPRKRREQKAAATAKARLSLVASRRAVDLDALEKELSSKDASNSQENRKAGDGSETNDDDQAAVCDHRVWFCDVVPECLTEKQQAQLPVQNEVITCNDQPMVKSNTDQMSKADEDYVFDIYYTNSAKVDFKTFENILAIETYSEEVEYVYDDGDDDDEVYDDEDDENAECNWRNDYPDEDPAVFWQRSDDNSWGYGGEDELADRMHDLLRIRGTGDGASSDDDFNDDDDDDIDEGNSENWHPGLNYNHYKSQLRKSLYRHDLSGD